MREIEQAEDLGDANAGDSERAREVCLGRTLLCPQHELALLGDDDRVALDASRVSNSCLRIEEAQWLAALEVGGQPRHLPCARHRSS